jgi:hypothetical protein
MVIQQKIDHRKLRWIKKKPLVEGFIEVTLDELKRYLMVMGIKWDKRGFYCFSYKGMPLKVIR